MENTEIVEKPVVSAPVAETVQDPFSLDENSLVSLTPEQRAGLDPIIDTWKKRANEEISKRESSASEKYKPLEEKAQALDKLTQYAPFVSWWQEQQKVATAQIPSQKENIQGTQPQDIATQSEWQEAIWQASNGDATKLQSLQHRMMSAWATPIVQEIRTEQKNLKTEIELKNLFERHPDAKELDNIGVDPKTKQGISLLEMALDWAERNKKPLEAGYSLAKQWSDALRVGAKQEAMGIVNSKKQDVTVGPSTAINNTSVVEVADANELLTKSLEAQLSGNKDVRFVIKGR